ncbi:MAG: signal peptide peptidase SppA [Planctomycetota bacterium]
MKGRCMGFTRDLVSICVAACTAASAAAFAADDAKVGLIQLSGALQDRPSPFSWLSGETELTVRSLTTAIEDNAPDKGLDAFVLQLEDAALSRSQIEEVGSALQRLRDAGVPVYVVTDTLGPTEVLLGSYADRVIAQSGTGLMLPGLYMEEMYLRDALEWVGVEPSFEQVGAYKGADEMFNNSSPSEPWSENIDQLLDSMYDNMRSQLAAGRGLDESQIDEAMTRAWLADAEDGVEVGLVDDTINLSRLTATLESDLGGDVSWISDVGLDDAGSMIDTSNPFAVFSLLSQDPGNDPSGPTIAVVHIDGAIVDGDSVQGGLFGSSSVGSRTIRRICKTLRDDDDIKGVVVRIDSPGGSATASEVIWQALTELREVKPVYVSVGSMAASGGYYIAVAGDEIYVNPSSIVGSIGVVGGKLAIAGMYDKLKINTVGRARGPHAAMFSSSPWTAEERAFVRERITDTYELFTGRVSAGREGIELDKTAEGRLFTGNRAIELNMADEIGSLSDTIAAMADDLQLRSFDVLDYPGPQSLEDLFDQLVPGGVQSPNASSPLPSVVSQAFGSMVGSAWPELRERIDAAIMLRSSPVNLLEHRVLHIR